MLEDNTYIKINEPGAGHIHPNPLHRKPQKQLLRRNPRQLPDLTVAQTAGNVAIVMQLALELGIAGLIQIDLESAIVIDDEVGDALGEQAHWEAMGAEDFVDGERSRS